MKSSSSLRSNDSSLINNASSGGSELEERFVTLCDEKNLLEKEEPRINSRSLKGTTLENRSQQDSSSNHLLVVRNRGQIVLSSPPQRPEGFIDNVVKVFFKGLKKTTTLEAVTDAFSSMNRIKYIRFPFSVVRKKNMGYGFVIFEDQDFAINLIHAIRFVEIDGARVHLSEFRKESRAEMRNKGRKEKYPEVPSAPESNPGSSPSVLDHTLSRCVGGTSRQSSELQGREKVSATWHRIKPTSASYHKSKRIPREWHNFNNIILNVSKVGEASKTSI
jgi:RNA recognition motif-containing protein